MLNLKRKGRVDEIASCCDNLCPLWYLVYCLPPCEPFYAIELVSGMSPYTGSFTLTYLTPLGTFLGYLGGDVDIGDMKKADE